MQFREAYFRAGVLRLADPEREVIGAWGLKDSTFGEQLARPATYVVDADGRVAWRHLPEDWRLRLNAEEYLGLFEDFDR